MRHTDDTTLELNAALLLRHTIILLTRSSARINPINGRTFATRAHTMRTLFTLQCCKHTTAWVAPCHCDTLYILTEPRRNHEESSAGQGAPPSGNPLTHSVITVAWKTHSTPITFVPHTLHIFI